MNQRRRRVLPLFLALAGLGVVATARPSWAETRLHGSDEKNYWLTIPEDWAWGRESDYAKHGAVEVAQKEYAVADDGSITLPDGTVLKGPYVPGVGGRVMLTQQDVPKELDPDYETWLMEAQTF